MSTTAHAVIANLVAADPSVRLAAVDAVGGEYSDLQPLALTTGGLLVTLSQDGAAIAEYSDRAEAFALGFMAGVRHATKGGLR